MKFSKDTIVEYFTPFQPYHPWSFSYMTLLFGAFILPFRFQWVEGVVIAVMYWYMSYLGAPVYKFFVLNLLLAAVANGYRSYQLRLYTKKHQEEE